MYVYIYIHTQFAAFESPSYADHDCFQIGDSRTRNFFTLDARIISLTDLQSLSQGLLFCLVHVWTGWSD